MKRMNLLLSILVILILLTNVSTAGVSPSKDNVVRKDLYVNIKEGGPCPRNITIRVLETTEIYVNGHYYEDFLCTPEAIFSFGEIRGVDNVQFVHLEHPSQTVTLVVSIPMSGKDTLSLNIVLSESGGSCSGLSRTISRSQCTDSHSSSMKTVEFITLDEVIGTISYNGEYIPIDSASGNLIIEKSRSISIVK